VAEEEEEKERKELAQFEGIEEQMEGTKTST
jgi:hypothetical protein